MWPLRLIGGVLLHATALALRGLFGAPMLSLSAFIASIRYFSNTKKM
jgi:hypothetical protein